MKEKTLGEQRIVAAIIWQLLQDGGYKVWATMQNDGTFNAEYDNQTFEIKVKRL